MLNKILVFGGLALSAILIVENMVTGFIAYVFIDASKAWVLSLVSIVIGFFIGFGFKGMFDKQEEYDENYDF